MIKEFIRKYLSENLGELKEHEPLANHTTLRVGGPARLLLEPRNKASLIKAIQLIKGHNIPFKVIGKGSNLLFSDELFDGVIIKTDVCLDYYTIEGDVLIAGAGVSDVKIARELAKLGLSGLEFLSGVPGTIGGAVFMNAGAYLKEIKEILIDVELINSEGDLIRLTKAELDMSYRSSIFHQHPDWIILEATIKLDVADSEEILDLIKKRKLKRKEAQPLELPSAGSTFRNPENNAAWKLVADAGLRGYTIGGAMVSSKHTNFVVNFEQATANDVMNVIKHVQKEVKRQFDLDMHQEVEFFNW